MRTTVTINDETLEELTRLAGTGNRSQTINVAINEFIRNERIRRFKSLRGRLQGIPSNEELESSDLERTS